MIRTRVLVALVAIIAACGIATLLVFAPPPGEREPAPATDASAAGPRPEDRQRTRNGRVRRSQPDAATQVADAESGTGPTPDAAAPTSAAPRDWSDLFRPGQYWQDQLRTVLREQGRSGLRAALEAWLERLQGTDDEPQPSALLMTLALIDRADGDNDVAAGRLLDAVLAMEPVPSAMYAHYGEQQMDAWPMAVNLSVIPRDKRDTVATSSQYCGVGDEWGWLGLVHPHDKNSRFGQWLLDLSVNRDHPEEAMAAAVLWHVLQLRRSRVVQWTYEGPAWSWREQDDERGRATAALFAEERTPRGLKEIPRVRELRASLRAQVFLNFQGVESEQAERIRGLVRVLLEPPARPGSPASER